MKGQITEIDMAKRLAKSENELKNLKKDQEEKMKLLENHYGDLVNEFNKMKVDAGQQKTGNENKVKELEDKLKKSSEILQKTE